MEPSLKSCGKSLSRRQPVASSKAITEVKDHRNARGGWHGCSDQAQQRGAHEDPHADCGTAAVTSTPVCRACCEGRACIANVTSRSRRVESQGRRAIWSEISASAAPDHITPTGPPPHPFRLGWKMSTLLHTGGPLVVLEDVHLTLGSTAGPVNILRGIS